MTVNQPLLLYTRSDCHLCEQAARALERAGIGWSPVDIDEDPELALKYGLHVPVIKHVLSGRELFYPFGDEQIRAFLDGG